MASLDEILQSFGAFKQGLQDLQVQRSISEANEQVQNIRATEANEAKQLAGIRSVANTMAMKMAGLGVTPEKAAGYSELVAPKPPTIQTSEQGMIMGDAIQKQDSQKVFQQEQENKLEQIRVKTAAEDRSKEAQRQLAAKKELRGELTKFDAFIKDDRKALGDVNNSLSLIDKGKFGAVMGLKSFIKTTDPKISDADFNIAYNSLSPAAVDQAKQYIANKLDGVEYEKNKDVLKAIGLAMKSNIENRVKDSADNYFNSRQGYLPFANSTPEEFKSALYNSAGIHNMGTLGAARATATAPNNSNPSQPPAPQGKSFIKRSF